MITSSSEDSIADTEMGMWLVNRNIIIAKIEILSQYLVPNKTQQVLVFYFYFLTLGYKVLQYTLSQLIFKEAHEYQLLLPSLFNIKETYLNKNELLTQSCTS